MTKVCPKHNKELRQGNNGSWFCATKVGDNNGNAIWCDTREYDNVQPATPSKDDVLGTTLTNLVKLVNAQNLEFKKIESALNEATEAIVGLQRALDNLQDDLSIKIADMADKCVPR